MHTTLTLSLSSTEHRTQIPLARPQLGDDEATAILEVLRSGQLCQGEVTEQFEQAIAQSVGVRHAVCVSSGSAALLVAMQSLGVGPGDEVIIPDITFVSTATAAIYLGARPVFCDIAAGSYCLDPAKVESLINKRTKAVVPVHLGGRVADVDAVRSIAAQHSVAVLEDAAGALGSALRGRMAGSLGDAAIFSFTPTKVITTGEGGAIVTNDDDLAQRCRRVRNFGDHGKFDWQSLGFNFRMTEIAAAIGREQLNRLDENICLRREIAVRYRSAFAETEGVKVPELTAGEVANYQLFPILLDSRRLTISRDEVIAELAKRGVASRLYYPALHKMPVFRGITKSRDEEFPVANHYEKSALCLPMFAGMSEQEQLYVIDALQEVLQEGNA